MMTEQEICNAYKYNRKKRRVFPPQKKEIQCLHLDEIIVYHLYLSIPSILVGYLNAMTLLDIVVCAFVSIWVHHSLVFLYIMPRTHTTDADMTCIYFMGRTVVVLINLALFHLEDVKMFVCLFGLWVVTLFCFVFGAICILGPTRFT